VQEQRNGSDSDDMDRMYGEHMENYTRYYASVSVLASRFRICDSYTTQGGKSKDDDGDNDNDGDNESNKLRLPFEWRDAFAPNERAKVFQSVAHEKLSMLFNLGACESARAAKSERSSLEGLKKASASFQRAAGYFQYILENSSEDTRKVRETFVSDVTSERIESDVSEKIASILVTLCLAQAQESVFEAAKLSDKSAGVLGKLAIACADLYEETYEKLDGSLRGSMQAPLTQERYIPKMWATTTYIKAAIFNAEASVRICDTLVNDEETIGSAITLLTRSKERLESALKRAEMPGPKPPKAVVDKAEKILRDSIKVELGKAVRDNECVYMAKVPSYEHLQRLHEDANEKLTNPLDSKYGAKMVKPTSSADIEVFLDPSNKDDISSLFSRIVPEDCANSASLYADKVDRLVREQLEQLAFASDEARVALRELELPETFNALNRPIALSASLDEEVKVFRERDGGIDAMRETLSYSKDVSKHCENELNEISSLLDIEMKADTAARNAYGQKYRALPSDAETTRWRRDLETFVNNSKIAMQSDEKLRNEFERCEPMLQLTTSESIARNAPKLEPPMLLVEDAESLAKQVRLGLERIENIGREREEIEDAMKAVKASDDILPMLVGKLKSSSSNNLNEEKIFREQLSKYDELVAAAQNNTFAQADALAALRKKYSQFSEMYNVSSLRERERKRDNTLREALRIAVELSRGIQQGVRFYGGFSDAIDGLKNEVRTWCENRTNERKRIVERLRREEEEEAQRIKMAEEVRLKTEQMRIENESRAAAASASHYYPPDYPPHQNAQQQQQHHYYPPPHAQQQRQPQGGYYSQDNRYTNQPPPPPPSSNAANDTYYSFGGFRPSDLPDAPRDSRRDM